MEELLSVVGRLYVDMLHAQKYIESMQNQLKDKDTEIIALKSKLVGLPKDKDKNAEEV
jgi:hypothetical protein